MAVVILSGMCQWFARLVIGLEFEITALVMFSVNHDSAESMSAELSVWGFAVKNRWSMVVS